MVLFYEFVLDGLNGETIKMDDVRLVNKLRTKFLLPPPAFSASHQYFLSDNEEDPSIGQAKMVREYLHNKVSLPLKTKFKYFKIVWNHYLLLPKST